MDKLQSVPQESKSDFLQPGPAPLRPPTEQLPCPWILQKQERKGQQCGNPTFNGDKYCTPHQIKVNKSNPEIFHSVNASQQQAFTPLPAIQPTIIHQQIPIQQVPPQQIYPSSPPQQPTMIPSTVLLEILQLFSSSILKAAGKDQNY